MGTGELSPIKLDYRKNYCYYLIVSRLGIGGIKVGKKSEKDSLCWEIFDRKFF